jgi:hypothetical protein
MSVRRPEHSNGGALPSVVLVYLECNLGTPAMRRSSPGGLCISNVCIICVIALLSWLNVVKRNYEHHLKIWHNWMSILNSNCGWLEYKRNWIQHVNRMLRNRLPRVIKHYSPTGRRNHGRLLKRLLDAWARNGSTSGLTPWQIYDDNGCGWLNTVAKASHLTRLNFVTGYEADGISSDLRNTCIICSAYSYGCQML